MNDHKASLSFAMAAAALLVAGCSSSEPAKSAPSDTAQQSLVKCEGVNECKGTSECKSTSNANGCQGLNDCKGQGWISIPKSECDKKGGKLVSEEPAAQTPPAASTGTGTGAGSEPPKTAAAIKCEGINECKGHSDCASESNGCKGQNECKGQGYVEVPSEADCLEKGGKVKA